MQVNNKKYIIISLIGVLIVGLFLINNKSNAIKLDEVNLKKIEQEKGMFAIMLQDTIGEDKYTQSEDKTWPSSGYEFNKTKSGCLDSDGKKIEDLEISYEEGKVKVETVNTSYCYIYFDIEEPMNLRKSCEGQTDMQNCITNNSTDLGKIQYLKNSNKGDLQYRYVGVQSDTVNNYVCFGDESCSAGAIDNHMYRIIGITSNGRIKIQKNKSIELASWHSCYKDGTGDSSEYCSTQVPTWSGSDIYTKILNEFYDNINYVSQSMKDKIAQNHIWNTGDVKIWNSTVDKSYGTKIYEQEKTTTSHTGEVGLAYMSDYYFSYNEQGTQNCTSFPYCNSWMMPNNKDEFWNGASNEWTMTRYGKFGTGDYDAWYVSLVGNVSTYDYKLKSLFAVRPVFYLTSDVTITEGDGTLEHPYILK